MPHNQNHKDSLEELFQKKAKEYDIRFKEDDWYILAKELDARDAIIGYKRKVAWMAAAAILIISLLGYFTFENYNRLNLITDQLADQMESIPSQQPSTEQFPTVIDGGNELPEEHATENQFGIPGTDVDTRDLSNAESITVLQDGEESQEVGPLRLIKRDVIREFTTAPLPTVAEHRPINTVYSTPVHMPTETSALNLIGPEPTGISPEFDKKTSGSFLTNLSISLLLSPDLSTVGSVSGFHNPGYKFGVVLEYFVTQNISVSSGVLQSMVRYSAPGNQYNAPVYWPNGISPEEIIAQCLLLDIPITLKFNFLTFERSRFFATAGASSYIMQNEDYQFSYSQDPNGQLESWSGQTGTRHWFSNAGFSIGYELDIHPNWSLRTEPFIKVPIKEIGWGNVKLYTLGSFISLNYRL
jgi:hypothetical protein